MGLLPMPHFQITCELRKRPNDKVSGTKEALAGYKLYRSNGPGIKQCGFGFIYSKDTLFFPTPLLSVIRGTMLSQTALNNMNFAPLLTFRKSIKQVLNTLNIKAKR